MRFTLLTLLIAAVLVGAWLVWRPGGNTSSPRQSRAELPATGTPELRGSGVARRPVDVRRAELASDEAETPSEPRVVLVPPEAGSRSAPPAPFRQPTGPGVVVLRGEVVDAVGVPVPSAVVQVWIGVGTRPRSGVVTTRVVDGRFLLRLVDSPPYSLRVTAAADGQFQPLNLQDKQLIVEDPSAELRVRLEAGTVLEGVVVDDLGAGVPGVRIRGGGRTRKTTEGGRFRLEGLPPGQVILQIDAPNDYSSPRPVVVVAGQLDVRVVLETATSISGYVRSADGKAIHGAHVMATWTVEGGPSGQAGTASRPDGSFRLRGVPPRATVTVLAQGSLGEGVRRLATTTLTEVRPGSEDVELLLGGGLLLSGTVRDADGEPAEGVVVLALRAGEGRVAGSGGVSADGGWTIEGLEAQRYVLAVLRGQKPVATEPLSVTAPASGITIELPGSTTLRGQVVGLGDTATRGWRVTAFHSDGRRLGQATITEEGAWELEIDDVPRPVYCVARNPRDNRYALLGPVSPSPEVLRLVVVEGKAISVVVAVPADLANRRVFVNARHGWLGAAAQELPGGRYVIRGLPPGKYTVQATVPGRGGEKARESSLLDVEPGDDEIRLSIPAAQ